MRSASGTALMSAAVVGGTTKTVEARRVRTGPSAARRHALVYGDIVPDFFMFNNPESACRTCGGIGTDKRTHPELLITNPERSIRDGCFLRDAFNYRPDNHRGYTIYSLGEQYGFDLDTPWQELERRSAGRSSSTAPVANRSNFRCRRMPRCSKEGWLRRPVAVPGHRRRHRAQLPLVPAAGRRQLQHGGLARPGDGRARVSGLPWGTRIRATRLLFKIADHHDRPVRTA